MLKQVPVSQEDSNLDPQGPVATGNLDLQVRVFTGIPMGKPTGNPQGPGPMLSPTEALEVLGEQYYMAPYDVNTHNQ